VREILSPYGLFCHTIIWYYDYQYMLSVISCQVFCGSKSRLFQLGKDTARPRSLRSARFCILPSEPGVQLVADRGVQPLAVVDNSSPHLLSYWLGCPYQSGFILLKKNPTLPISSSEDPDDLSLLLAPAFVLVLPLPRMALVP
jgi:hypothetical protein